MPGKQTSLSISEMAEETGVTSHTLRYYERVGLIRPVARNSRNQRQYSAAEIEWVKFLLRLRETDMPIAQMRRYAQLRELGPSTTRQRLGLLTIHQASLRRQIAALRSHEQALATKISTYQQLLAASEDQNQGM